MMAVYIQHMYNVYLGDCMITMREGRDLPQSTLIHVCSNGAVYLHILLSNHFTRMNVGFLEHRYICALILTQHINVNLLTQGSCISPSVIYLLVHVHCNGYSGSYNI